MSFVDELKRRNVIRVAIGYLAGVWLLIQILETLFPIFGIPETSIRIVVIVAAIGFVPVLVASWYFELTPEGLKRDSDAQRLQHPTTSHRTADRLIAIVLMLAVVYFAVDKFVLDPSRDAADIDVARKEGRADALVESFGDKSIVVLPFVNMSSDPEQEYLGDGLAEELLNLLTGIDGLRVISRTSAFSYKGKDVTLLEIANNLNVGYVLEGSVRRSGDSLRITAQLIDARADAHVWSDTYDRTVEDIFVIQDEVAAEVAERLKLELALGPPTTKRHDPVAYALFLRARHLFYATRSYSEDVEKLLLRALELDANYADAKILLAWIHSFRGDEARLEGDQETADTEYQRADMLAAEAAATSPDNVQVLIWRAWQSMRDVTRAAQIIERALSIDPTNPDVLNTAVVLLTRLWRSGEAIPLARYARERDPLSTFVVWNLARAYRNNGEHAAAAETLADIVALNPEAVRAAWGIGFALLLQSEKEQALAHFDNHVSDPAYRLHGRVLALHDLGRSAEANAALKELLELDESNAYAYLIGTAYAWIGDLDNAFRYLEMERDTGEGSIFRVEANSPLYANLGNDPRWLPFLESVELAPEFLASVEFNPRLPPGIEALSN